MNRIFCIAFFCFLFANCHNRSETQSADTTTTQADVLPVPVDTTDNHRRETISSDWLLMPGISAGQTKIGEDADSVYQRLGTPDGGDAAMQKAVAIWFAHHDTTAYSVAIYTARNTDSPTTARVLQIRVTSPAFATSQGIHATSSLTDIQKIFSLKKTEQYRDAGKNYQMYDSNSGIAFEMASDSTCVAIIIHKAGVTGEGTYLKFRTTNKFIDRKK